MGEWEGTKDFASIGLGYHEANELHHIRVVHTRLQEHLRAEVIKSTIGITSSWRHMDQMKSPEICGPHGFLASEQVLLDGHNRRLLWVSWWTRFKRR